MEREYRICKPKEFSSKEKQDIINLIKEGEAVAEFLVRIGINRAEMVACCFDEDKLVGVGAIKLPFDSYKIRIHNATKTEEDIRKYNIELGYISVHKSFQRQGIGSTIVKKLLPLENANIFATTRKEGMRKILLSNGFEETGKPYGDEKPEKLRLFVKRKM